MSALSELCQDIVICQKCEALTKNRTRVVPGDGLEDADLMFIGEAPGRYEDQQGIPFVGPAGLFLEQLLASINLRREQVYITNVIKCRPPNNRDPLPSEVHNCREWLDRQIEIINPKIVVTLGRYSMAMFFSGKSISKIHGTAQKRGDIIYYAMYHPAAALHQQSLRRVIEEDMLKIPSLLDQAESVLEVKQPPQQLNMFEVKNRD
ncbi:MAG: uracil-DNA glycosylase [Dehalococcoidales bacterium]|jgi:DNA polymerase|nr:uracil-DNA glycosylase [Dehalococcoidales bacterium]